MNLIEKIGNIVQAEMIASCLLTTANNPEYFSLNPKQYFNVVDGIVYFYNDDEQQFFEYKPLVECDFEYVLIADLRTAIANHDQNLSEQRERFEKAYSLKFPESKVTLLPNGNYSGWIKQKKWKDWQAKQEQLQSELNICCKKDLSEISITDHCTDICNHISPLTGVIER